MTFQSVNFLVFAVILWFVLFFLKSSEGAKKNVLLLASYYFYMAWDLRFAAVLATLTAINYWGGAAIGKATSAVRRKSFFLLAVLGSLLVLSYFKYANFFVAEIEALLRSFGLSGGSEVLKIVLPIGISFYTFQSLSYVFDVYRGKIAPTTSVRDFALFVSFFPTVLSGPISRAAGLLPQIERGGTINGARCDEGLILLVRGFVKKLLFADNLALHIVDPAFANPGEQSSLFLIFAVYAYSFQIYMDLSGYTDIARGVAKIFGFDLVENFNWPYSARSISEFWQRWHMSMSGFFRDYLYHSIGGSKHGNVYFNLLLTFVAIGVWHGAGWNFVLYGLIHGAFVGWERFARGRRELQGEAPAANWLVDVWKIAFTFSVVSFSRILFRSDDLSSAWLFVRAIFEGTGSATQWSLAGLAVFLAAVLLHLLPPRFDLQAQRWCERLSVGSKILGLVGIFYFLLSVSLGTGGFIYFKF